MKKILSLLKKIKIRDPRTVFCIILILVIPFLVANLVKATTPNPGHPWTDIGNGTFQVANTQSALHSYTFPDATATVLTSFAPVTVAQGGIGTSSFTIPGFVYSPGGTTTLVSSSSPVVGYITATSTTATSTFVGNVAVGTNLAVTGQGLFNINNIDYNNVNGSGAAIILNNPNASGQNVIYSMINGVMVAKWRTDSVGDINWVANATGAHVFYTGGDYPTGTAKMAINNDGHIVIGVNYTQGVLSPAWLTVASTSEQLRLSYALAGGSITSQYSSFITNSTGGLTISSNGTTPQIVLANNVGIGTTSPTNALAVVGNGYFAGNLTAGNLTATGTATINTLNLTNDLSVTNGGTGTSSLTLNGVMIGNGTSNVTLVPLAATGTILQSNGTAWATASSADPVIFNPVALYPNAVNAVTAMVSGTSYFQYMGVSPKAYTQCTVLASTTTAAATVTWAEVALMQGTPVLSGNAVLSKLLGYTSVATTFNSVGKKTTVVTAAIPAGTPMWVVFGSTATTAFQLRGMMADAIQTGTFQTLATRPSTATFPLTTTLAGNAVVPIWTTMACQ